MHKENIFREKRLIFQQPGENPPPTEPVLEIKVKHDMALGELPEEAQKKVDAAKGDNIQLDETARKAIIEERNTPRFSQWIRQFNMASDALKAARNSNLLPLLPENERRIIGKGSEKIVLTGENWNKTIRDINLINEKIKIFELILKNNKHPEGQYLGSIDRAVALVSGKKPYEAAMYLQDYFNLRLFVAQYQRQKLLNQDEVNAYLKTVDSDPTTTLEKLLGAIEIKKARQEMEKSS